MLGSYTLKWKLSQSALQYIATPADLNNPISFSLQAVIKALEH
jgi:hypothetical protein